MKEYRNFYCAQKPKNYLETNALHKQLHTHTHTQTCIQTSQTFTS